MGKSLTELAAQNNTAKILFNELSQRERFRSRSDLRKLFAKLSGEHRGMDKNDFMELFQTLQDMGLGSIIHGRGTNPTRFDWHYNLKDIGLAAKGKLPMSQIQSLSPSGGSYAPRSGVGSGVAATTQPRPVQAQQTARPDTSTGFELLIISPSGIERFKVPSERTDLVRKLLSEFAEQI